VLTLLEGSQITTAQAAEALGLTTRQVRRLRAGLRCAGPAALIHGNRGHRSSRRLPDGLRTQLLALARGRYAGLNDHHLTEKLTAVEGIAVSRATVQRVLRAAGVVSPRRRRPPRHRSRRPRRAQAGLLLQLDGSPFAWFGPTQPICSLLGAIDDATGAVLAGTFRAQEDAAGYLRLLHTLGRTVGLPAAVYTDGHGIFVRHDTHWTLAEELQGVQDPTQVGRALQALGIHHIVADSPQAKGRIERLWNTLQDRLVAELRLAGIATLAEANAFLPGFTGRFNARFARAAADTTPAWRPVPRGLDLDRICSLYTAATVLNDNTVRIQGTVLQIPAGPGGRGYAKARVEVRQLLDGSWRVYHHDRLLVRVTATAGPPVRSLRQRRYPTWPSPAVVGP
jgi:hypothetical protein